MSDLQKVLAPGEQVLWEGKPQFWPFIFSVIPLVIATIIFVPIFFASESSQGSGIDQGLNNLLIVGLILMLGPGYFIYKILVYRFVSYVITDKRTIIQDGVIGRDFESIEHDAVVSTAVSVGLIDKLLGKNSGTVNIIHAGSPRIKGTPRPSGLVSVTDPYAVYQIFNKISHDVRSDIQYPNALRPENNPGYKTGYQGETPKNSGDIPKV